MKKPSKKTVVKKSYQVWMVIEEHKEFSDGTEKYRDLKQEETRSLCRVATIEEANEIMNEIANGNFIDKVGI